MPDRTGPSRPIQKLEKLHAWCCRLSRKTTLSQIQEGVHGEKQRGGVGGPSSPLRSAVLCKSDCRSPPACRLQRTRPASLRQPDDAVVERLLRPGDIRAIRSARATAQGVYDSAQHLSHQHASSQGRLSATTARPEPIPDPKARTIRGPIASQIRGNESRSTPLGIPALGYAGLGPADFSGRGAHSGWRQRWRLAEGSVIRILSEASLPVVCDGAVMQEDVARRRSTALSSSRVGMVELDAHKHARARFRYQYARQRT